MSRQSEHIAQNEQGDIDELIAEGVEPSAAYDIVSGRVANSLSPEVEQAVLQHLAHLADAGEALQGTTPGQTWAMHKLIKDGVTLFEMMSPEGCDDLNARIEGEAQGVRDRFEECISDLDDKGAIVNAAYDEAWPAFLRLPLQQAMRETFDSMFPGLKPSGVDDAGQAVYNLADIGAALGASEEDLLAHAEDAGFADQLSTRPPNPLH